MSEPIPESVPTSHDPRSHRPVKRQAISPRNQQASRVDALFANPDREIQIANATRTKGIGPPPEIVNNVQGSSAGAGSGEFHVYKASRRREYERLKLMEEEVQKEKDVEQFEREREEKANKEEKRMGKNKARRDRAKERKRKVTTEKDPESSTESQPFVDVSHSNDAIQGSARSGGTMDVPKAPQETGLVIHDED